MISGKINKFLEDISDKNRLQCLGGREDRKDQQLPLAGIF